MHKLPVASAIVDVASALDAASATESSETYVTLCSHGSNESVRGSSPVVDRSRAIFSRVSGSFVSSPPIARSTQTLSGDLAGVFASPYTLDQHPG